LGIDGLKRKTFDPPDPCLQKTEVEMQYNIIETQGLTRRFGNLKAVSDVDLCVPEASVYGFLGPNGAGKTTTIRMLLGLIKPHRGEVSIFGKSIQKARLEILGRLGAMVEQPSFYPHLTGRENLEIVRRLRGLQKAAISDALAIVKLEDAANRQARHYSTGMKQRLGLAIALMGQPELLILDEPTNGLDPAGIHEMRDLIVNLPEEFGITVFLSSHLLNEVEQMATQIGIIRKGQLIFQGNPETLQAQLNESVVVSVDQPDKAKTVLAEAGWSVQRNGSQKLYVEANGQSDAAMINSQLLGAGVSVYQVSLERPSLEDIFLKVTEE
jgi:ABC-2 type transport system ATP-binding protein